MTPDSVRYRLEQQTFPCDVGEFFDFQQRIVQVVNENTRLDSGMGFDGRGDGSRGQLAGYVVPSDGYAKT